MTTKTTKTTTTTTPTVLRSPIPLYVAAVLLFALGAMTTVGAFIFYVPSGLLAAALLATLVAGSLGMIFTAFQLHRGRPLVWNLARSLTILHVLWSIYKVFPYGETESAPFLAAGVLILVLLHLPASRSFVQDTHR
jgi:hypothetical protein